MDEFRIPLIAPVFPAFLKFENGSLKSSFDLDMFMPLTFATNCYDELVHDPEKGSRQAVIDALDHLSPIVDEPALARAVDRMALAYMRQGSLENIRLSILAAQMCFPIHYELYGYFAESPADEFRVQDPGDYPAAFQAATLEGLLKTLFGCYRKDLAKAVVRASEEHLLRAWLHSSSMPIDWVIDYLRTSDPEDSPAEFTLNAPAYRSMASTLKPGDSKRILHDRDPLIEDTVAMWCGKDDEELLSITTKKIKSTRDFHDRLLTLERKSAYSKYLIPEGFPEALESLNEPLTAEGLSTEIVLDSSRAADVGAILRNCCGASFNRQQGETGALVFVILNRESNPYALASFTRLASGTFALRELKANANTPIPDLETQIKECLKTQDAPPAQ